MPLVRQRRLRRGARRRGGELTDPAGAIRPAVEAALAVARDGLSADPIVPPPQALRRYLGFSRLSPGALRAIARVVERDDAFRTRVAAAVDEDKVGRAGWLWLERPEGWADELAAIDAEDAARAEEERRARDERSAVKKLAAAQAAAADAAAEAERRAREAEELRAEVARQRALQADVTTRLVEAESQAERLAAARTAAVRNLKDVEARLVERSTELNAAKSRIRELEEWARSRGDFDADGRTGAGTAGHRAASSPGAGGGAGAGGTGSGPAIPGAGRAGAGVADGGPRVAGSGARDGGDAGSLGDGDGAGAGLPAGRDEPPRPRRPGEDGGGPAAAGSPIQSAWRPPSAQQGPADRPGEAAQRRQRAESFEGGQGGAAPAPASPAAPPRHVLADELARAAAGAASLADSLAALARLLDPAADGAERAAAEPAPAVGPAVVSGDAGSADAPRLDVPPAGIGEWAPGSVDLSAPTVRVPVRLPGGIFDDSVAAAEHLLRTAGLVLVVDGYNVTMTAWPSLSAAEQRRRLVGVLAELAARTATEIEIVFDGADVASVPVPAPVRSLVHVRFSPPGVEADDIVLDLVASLPTARPVVVASSDNRVRDGARALGANLVHARQLLDALRR